MDEEGSEGEEKEKSEAERDKTNVEKEGESLEKETEGREVPISSQVEGEKGVGTGDTVCKGGLLGKRTVEARGAEEEEHKPTFPPEWEWIWVENPWINCWERLMTPRMRQRDRGRGT